MEFRSIKRDDTSRITPHFRTNEFFSTSPAAGYGNFAEHSLAQPVISAAEFLRCHFGTPWRVTSTYRTEAHELHICQVKGLTKQLAKGSQHVAHRAMDSQPANGDESIILRIHADFLNRGELFAALRELGITGFGIYDTFLHLDCRDTTQVPAKQADSLGPFAFWDERTDATKKKAPLFLARPILTTPPTLMRSQLLSRRSFSPSPGQS